VRAARFDMNRDIRLPCEIAQHALRSGRAANVAGAYKAHSEWPTLHKSFACCHSARLFRFLSGKCGTRYCRECCRITADRDSHQGPKAPRAPSPGGRRRRTVSSHRADRPHGVALAHQARRQEVLLHARRMAGAHHEDRASCACDVQQRPRHPVSTP